MEEVKRNIIREELESVEALLASDNYLLEFQERIENELTVLTK